MEEIRYIADDFLVDNIGKGYDLIFISQVFHSLSKEEIIHVLRKSRQALNPSGRVVIQEFYIDAGLTYPLQSALFSVNMLVNTPYGRCYPLSELEAHLRDTGFDDLKGKIIDDIVLIFGKRK